MFKRLYVFHKGKPCEVIIRQYEQADFDQLIEVQRKSFPPPFPEELWWDKDQLHSHISLFPEGALCAEVNGEIIGSITGLKINEADYEHKHTWAEVTADGFISNHNANGDTLYIVDICVIPTYRKSGIGKWLMQSMYETVVQLRLKKLLGGGRMPGYYKVAHSLTAQQYLEAIVNGEQYDPVISFLMKCGRVPVRLITNYLDDEESHHYATLMEWKNPFIT